MASLLAVLLTAPTASAAAPGKVAGGLTVSPSFQQIVIGATDREKTFEYTLTNNSGQTLELALSAVDFGSLDESGGVLFLGQNNTTLNYKYGLRQYVTLQRDRVVVEPGATVKVPVTVANKDSLSPGGHYGAILATPVQTEQSPAKVQVNEVISSLLFVTKQGGAIYSLDLQSYELKTHLFFSPSAVDMRFLNSGNVHGVPRGLVTISDPGGRVVKRGFLNAGSGIILPESFRKFSVPLQPVAIAWRPGTYHMTLTYHFDGETAEHTKQVTFTYINGWYVVGAVVVLAMAVLAAFDRPFRQLCVFAGRLVFSPLRWLGRLVWRGLKQFAAAFKI